VTQSDHHESRGGWIRSIGGARFVSIIGVLAALAGGCGGDARHLSMYVPPDVRLEAWGSISATACNGTLVNRGSDPAQNVTVQLLYSIAGRDSVLTVALAAAIPGYGRSSFSAPAQVTRGEPRFPRLAGIHWVGGSSHGEPEPVIALGAWCRVSADSVRETVYNDGGLVYHLFVRLESGDGVLDVAVLPDPLGTPSGPGIGPVDQTISHIVARMRDSSGVSLLPDVIKAQWEDFAGVVDSASGPVFQSELLDCPSPALEPTLRSR
jgi:hypothetical protein